MGQTEAKLGHVTGFYTIHEGKIIRNLAHIADDGEIYGGYEHMNSYPKFYQNFDTPGEKEYIAKLIHKVDRNGDVKLYLDGPNDDGSRYYSQTKPDVNYYLSLHKQRC